MALIAQSRRNNLWFGTEEWMQFVPTPNSGAEVSPAGWDAEGTLLNGGGFARGSFGSHRRYIFEWPATSSREAAQLMKSYASGTFGRGLIYFVDPLIYDTNTFPAAWADPSMCVGYEGVSHVRGVQPMSLPASNWKTLKLPAYSAYYDLSDTAPGWRGKQEAVFLPIPDGYTLHLGAIYSADGSGGVLYRTQSENGGLGPIQTLTPLDPAGGILLNASETSASVGVWVWFGRTDGSASSVTVNALTSRLYRTSTPNALLANGPWFGGQGHSGCRFAGKPTLIENTGVGGGQVGYAASFIEVGSWLGG